MEIFRRQDFVGSNFREAKECTRGTEGVEEDCITSTLRRLIPCRIITCFMSRPFIDFK